MNQDELKALLLKVRPAPKEFTLIYTGKKSKTANGMYCPETAEIIINNKNAWIDSQLIKTGLHEYAHHLQFCQEGKTNHARAFQAILADLTTEAMSQGFYAPDYSGVKDYCTQIRSALATITQLEKTLGNVLHEFSLECTRQGLDFFEVADRELKLTRRSLKRYDSARQLEMFPEDIEATPDLVAAVAAAPKKEKQETLEKILGGGTASQAAMPKPAKPAESEYTTPQLIKEKKRLEKTMHKLADRLEQIDETLSARLEKESEPHPVITTWAGMVSSGRQSVPTGTTETENCISGR